mmetsp:Transcript_20029/g.63810  ORF Transcript_20029/g.63810 Transcript_20029/m.63810 type:complete len:385 (+) Transcript_20029:193-1347(+)
MLRSRTTLSSSGLRLNTVLALPTRESGVYTLPPVCLSRISSATLRRKKSISMVPAKMALTSKVPAVRIEKWYLTRLSVLASDSPDENRSSTWLMTPRLSSDGYVYMPCAPRISSPLSSSTLVGLRRLLLCVLRTRSLGVSLVPVRLAVRDTISRFCWLAAPKRSMSITLPYASRCPRSPSWYASTSARSFSYARCSSPNSRATVARRSSSCRKPTSSSVTPVARVSASVSRCHACWMRKARSRLSCLYFFMRSSRCCRSRSPSALGPRSAVSRSTSRSAVLPSSTSSTLYRSSAAALEESLGARISGSGTLVIGHSRGLRGTSASKRVSMRRLMPQLRAGGSSSNTSACSRCTGVGKSALAYSSIGSCSLTRTSRSGRASTARM